MLPFIIGISISFLGGYGTFGVISEQVRGPNYYRLAPLLDPFFSTIITIGIRFSFLLGYGTFGVISQQNMVPDYYK